MDVLLPPLAEGADSGTVVSILVSEGDRIENEQPVIELENEKAVAPIPSTAAGVVSKIHVSEGDTISEGQPLVSVDENGDGASSNKSQSKAKAPQEQPKKQASKSKSKAKKSSSGGGGGKRTDVTLPALAEGADSGTVVSILVSKGDSVEVDQPVIELENEKAVAPIPSTVAGTIVEIYVNEGDTVNEGQKLVAVGEAGAASDEGDEEASDEGADEGYEEEPQTPADAQTHYEGRSVRDSFLDYRYQSSSGFPPPTSPTIRKIAKDIGLDLTRVKGSGNGGRITLDDVKTYIGKLQELADRPRQAAPSQSQGQAQSSAPAKKPKESIDFSQWGDVKREKVSSLRKTIGRRLQEAWNDMPHVYQFDEADITDVMEMRKKYKAAYTKKDASLTLTGIIIKAVASTLNDFPIFNASLDEAKDELVFKQYCHLGVAVDTEAGLVVPVIRDADKKSLLDISLELQELAEKARDRKLSADEMKGSSFTISNLGGIGGTHFTPIVNPPNTAILGVGRGSVKPVYDGKKFVPRTFMSLCVSYDHRVIDGADGARFIKALTEAIQSFPENEIKLTSSKKK